MSRMSHDEFSDFLDDEPIMEIEIRTLMATVIELKVWPSETVEDIKKKIYRVDAIPINQQILIFGETVLNNSSTVSGVGIVNGSKLTLLPSMRGGPISTKRVPIPCEHYYHTLLNDLRLSLAKRSDVTPGSKVSLLVYREGDVLNCLRVVENEDGSYTPYCEPISRPQNSTSSTSRDSMTSNRTSFQRSVEDNTMNYNMKLLRKKMSESNLRKREKINLPEEEPIPYNSSFSKTNNEGVSSSNNIKMPYQLHTGRDSDVADTLDLTIYEKNINSSESVEVALKDKHRVNQIRLPQTNSLFTKNKNSFSYTKENYARIHKKMMQKREDCIADTNCSESSFGNGITSSFRGRMTGHSSLVDTPSRSSYDASIAERFAMLEDDNQELFDDGITRGLSVSARNTLHLSRLVLSESVDRPKRTTDSLELPDTTSDLWEIHTPPERREGSTTCKIGLLKGHQNVEYAYDSLEETSSNSPEVGMCARNLFYNGVSPLVSPTGPISSHCSFPRENSGSPLYRRTLSFTNENNELGLIHRVSNELSSLDTSASTDYGSTGPPIEVIPKNNKISDHQNSEVQASRDSSSKSSLKLRPIDSSVKLPPVVKKKARCGECTKRLNITNIYDCRCGKMFCAQHRYSETHACTYDYKMEDRKNMDQQNFKAEKVKRF